MRLVIKLETGNFFAYLDFCLLTLSEVKKNCGFDGEHSNSEINQFS